MKLFKRTWKDYQAMGDKHRNRGDPPSALHDYERAVKRFDGSKQQRDALEQRMEAMRVDLGSKWLEKARAGAPIHYLVTETHAYTMVDYLGSWGRPLEGRIHIVSYKDLLGRDAFPAGVYIFSDLDRLNEPQLELLGRLWQRLYDAGPGFRLLNQPNQSLDRCALLRRLFVDGQNEFNAYYLKDAPRPLKAPVFIREARGHRGGLTQLITDQKQFDDAVAALIMSGIHPRDLLVVEYCNTADSDGIYRKYSCFRIGDRIIPRHQIFSENWVLKYPDLLEPGQIEEEWQFLKTNPHEQEIRRIYDAANIEYGRIDYSVLNGKIQVWEINTNPIVMMAPDKYEERHIPAQQFFAPLAREAFEALAANLPESGPVKIDLDELFLQRIIEKYG